MPVLVYHYVKDTSIPFRADTFHAGALVRESGYVSLDYSR